jgi:glycosyltransferase involved in cell wall biosynthesis
MNPPDATVSVVIPCYNGSRFLRETLASVLRQTAPASEILVVDDGSTDDSADVAESFGPPVRVIRQANGGESTARNRGIDEARGDWIAFLDADDVWEPHKLERQLAAVGPGDAASCTGYYLLHEPPQVPPTVVLPRPEAFTVEGVCEFGCPCQISSVIVRRASTPRFPTWTRYAEDMVYLLELLRQGPIAVVREPLLGYRRHPGSQSVKPDILLRWHDTLETWLRGEEATFGPQLLARLRSLASAYLAHAGEIAYWRRDWVSYDLVCQRLRDSPGGAGARGRLGRRLPRWCYAVKDWMDARFSRGCHS